MIGTVQSSVLMAFKESALKALNRSELEALEGFIYPGNRDHAYAFTGAFSGGTPRPPARGYGVLTYSLATALSKFGYTWTLVSGSMGGLTLGTAGQVSGTITKTPVWSSFPISGALPYPGHAQWNDSMYHNEWRGVDTGTFVSGSENATGPFYAINPIINLATNGISPPIGRRRLSIPVLADIVYGSHSVVLPSEGSIDMRPMSYPPEVAVSEPIVGTDQILGYAGLVSQSAGVINFSYSGVTGGIGVHIGFKAGSGWLAVIDVPVGFGATPSFVGSIFYRSAYGSFGNWDLEYIGMSSGIAGSVGPGTGSPYLDATQTPPPPGAGEMDLNFGPAQATLTAY